jgi:hypothetical protein
MQTEEVNNIENVFRRVCIDFGAELLSYKNNGATFQAKIKRNDYTVEIPVENYTIDPVVFYNKLSKCLALKENEK